MKPFHFDHQFDYALIVLLDSWMAVTALLEASPSILEGLGQDAERIRETIARGDRALVASLRRDCLDERSS